MGKLRRDICQLELIINRLTLQVCKRSEHGWQGACSVLPAWGNLRLAPGGAYA